MQRDFLQGSSVEEYLRAALKPVPHPSGDEHGERLNAIRASLALFDGGAAAAGWQAWAVWGCRSRT